jgi:superfamily II DNA or RNA helicase
MESRNPMIKIDSNDSFVLDYIRDKFSIPNKAKKYSRYASDNICPITPVGSFLPGLFFDILKELKIGFPKYDIDYKDIKDLVFPFSIKDVDIVNPENKKYIYRDYQLDGIKQGLKYGRGVFDQATGAGKSLLMYGLLKNIQQYTKNKKCLILVPNVQLVKQLYGDFTEYGCPEEDICMFSSFSKDKPDKNIIISNRQWLEGHSKELHKLDFIFIDEAHGLKSSNKVSKYIRKLETNIRFGFTGSIPENKEDEWNLLGICGKILSVKKPFELQKEGHIAGTNILTIQFKHKCRQPKVDPSLTSPLDIAKARFPTEWRYIENCYQTNEMMCKMALKLNGNSIGLYDHIEHGEELFKILKEENEKYGKKVFNINGSTPVEEREKIRKLMEEEDDCVLLANTKCFSVGINIKNIHNILFMFSSGTSGTKILQSIGRGIRKSFSKFEMLLVDFYHNFRYSGKHYEERKKLYIENYDIDHIKEKQIVLKDPIEKI